MNSTPNYLGKGQPPPSHSCDGPLAWLESLFGIFGSGGTPVYLGKGQPAPSSGDGGGTVYRAPPPKPASNSTPDPTTANAAVPGPCPYPDPFGGMPYAIVIPRQD